MILYKKATNIFVNFSQRGGRRSMANDSFGLKIGLEGEREVRPDRA